MRLLAATTALILLAGCAQDAPIAPAAAQKASILDTDDAPAVTPSITEQVAESARRNEGGLDARNRDAREAHKESAEGAPERAATVAPPSP